MIRSNRLIWNNIASRFAAELVTSTSEVHFGVGIPGNSTLNLIHRKPDGTALDLGCGAGENLVALSRLGYKVTGIDGSASQLKLAEELLTAHEVHGKLILGDVCDFALPNDQRFDVIISVDVMHFCSSLDDFITVCAKLAKPETQLILSMPHPLDMIVERSPNSNQIVVRQNYFPENNRIDKAYYWRKFAGKLELTTELIEHLCRPSDVINTLIQKGFRIEGIWEPRGNISELAPCRYRSAEPWVTEVLRAYVPPDLIVKSIFQEHNHNL
jgi:2-polyprenyl-3-methyl-5-hydroxy-6-metoxy-1,4-benzoquinol methylase